MDEDEDNNNHQMETENNDVHPLALVAVNVDLERGGTPSLTDEDSNESTATRKRTFEEDVSDDEGALCPICLDNWTNSGDHRICALKCGHLFGLKCINTWLGGGGRRTCPTCKKKVGKTDIRYIYAKKLTAVDTVELDALRSKLEKVTQERNGFEIELATVNYREQLLKQEIALLKAQTQLHHHYNLNNHTHNERVSLFMDKSIEICRLGGSRVFDARVDLDLLLASIKVQNNLFASFGLQKIAITDYRKNTVIPVHNAQIRDMAFHKEQNWVLTASMDKSFKVINNNENSVIYKHTHQMPLWSCCWDQNNPFCLFVGTQSGNVHRYDVRNLTEPIKIFSIEGDMSPVVSVASIPSSPGYCLPQGGVASCKLNSFWLYENLDSDEPTRHSLSLEGPFVSMKYQNSSKHLLVSSRPNNRVTYARHSVCTLERRNETKIDCNMLHSFQGGGMQKLLSKSCFLSHANDYVAAYQENCKSVVLWSVNTGQRVTAIAAHESVLDLKGLESRAGDFLVSLTEKKIEFFKFS